MDPQTVKLIQRLIMEIVGVGIIIWGIVFIYRGIAGKINFIMQGAGVKVKLLNASPGAFFSLIGALIMWYSMQDFSIERKTVTKEETPTGSTTTTTTEPAPK